MTVLFRCTAGSDIGYGHLVRCRALAQAFFDIGETCIMVGPGSEHARPEDKETFSDWVTVADWGTAYEDAAFLVHLANQLKARGAVLDDYRVDATYQLTLRAAGLRWLQFDGTARLPLWADLVLNANPAARPQDYSNVLRNPATRLLLGSTYAILRPEFTTVLSRGFDRQVKRILVTFGGGDDRQAILRVLSVLLPFAPADVTFRVMIGKNNPNLDEIACWVARNASDQVVLYVDPNDVASLYKDADFAIMAGGMSSFEAASLGVPMILTSIADNQLSVAQTWENRGVAINLGPLASLEDVRLIEAFKTMISEHEQRALMADAGRRLVDGNGPKRVVQAFLCN